MKLDDPEVLALFDLVRTGKKLPPFQRVLQHIGKDGSLAEDVCNAIALATCTKGATKYGSREGLLAYLEDMGVERPKVPSGNTIMAAIKPYGRTKEDQLRLEWLQQRENQDDDEDDGEDVDDAEDDDDE